MTDAMIAPGPANRRDLIRSRVTDLRQKWTDATPKTRSRVQIGALLISVLVAYNYSLRTLLETADEQTPLAYVSLVPVIALALAAIRARPVKREPAIHDRQVDYIIGVPLIVIAVTVNELLPSRMSALFWVYRIDLLTMPIFVAGAVALIFGTRILWRQKLAIAFLFLAWPWPYQRFLLGLLNAFTDLTLFAMRKIAVVTHLAKPAGTLDNTLFVVAHHGTTFPLSVVSACSGVNGIVGFLLIGSAFAAVVKGPFGRKLAWLAGGMALLWVLNLGRITFIFFAGKEWGEGVAINVFHPFVGLVTFSLGVVVMILLIKPLGMRIDLGVARTEASVNNGPKPVPDLDNPRPRSRIALAVPKVYLALVVALVAAVVLGISNLGLRTYNLVADVSGNAKLLAYIGHPVVPTGWDVRYETTYEWAKPLFGDTSTWNRYIMRADAPGPLHTNIPVVADVINTPDLSSFSAYGVENCYAFHGYALADVARVSLVGGITGQAMSYTSQAYGSWSIVYWIVPVKMGTSTNYERTVLYVQNSNGGAQLTNAKTGRAIQNVAGSLDPQDLADRTLINNRTFLVAYAEKLIEAQSAESSRQPSPSVVAGSSSEST